MADAAPQDVMTTIDRLLARRQQFEEWIAKLDAAAAGAPDAVRTRVRADYQARLDETLDELRNHQGEIASQLADLRVQQDELVAREREASEALAEAELRHAVGEFDDRHFEKLRKEHDRTAAEARGRLERIAGEIGRLGDVQALIAPPTPVVSRMAAPAPKAEAPPPPSRPAEPAPEPAAAEPPGPPPSAPRFEPRPAGKGEGPPRTLILEPGARPQPAGDELAFLKSVTDEPRRPVPKPEPPAASKPPAAAAPSPPPADKGTGARTLRCGECGAMNRPTEWYCEKCGAELAAL